MLPVQIVNVFNFVDYEESNRKRKREEEIGEHNNYYKTAVLILINTTITSKDNNIIAENPLKKARKNDEPSEHSNGAKHNSETNYAAKVESPSEGKYMIIRCMTTHVNSYLNRKDTNDHD